MHTKHYESKRVVITGGAGFLASAIVRTLGQTGCHIVRVDRAGSRFHPVAGLPVAEDICGDVCDPGTWERILPGADVVFHLAAQTSAYKAFIDPLLDLHVNQLAMLHLLEVCRRRNWSPDVVFAGTATECGLTAALPVSESYPDHPTTIYDLHKWTAEQYLKQYVQAGLAHGTVLRLANVYGPGPRSSNGERGVLNAMARKAINGEPLTVYGDGEYVRDYVFVDDVARAFLAAGACMERLEGRHFMIGSGAGRTISDAVGLVATRAKAHTGRTAPVVHIPPPPALLSIERRNFVADISSFCHETGWRPEVPLDQGVDLTITAIMAEEAGE